MIKVELQNAGVKDEKISLIDSMLKYGGKVRAFCVSSDRNQSCRLEI
jgi:hypothetical protein